MHKNRFSTAYADFNENKLPTEMKLYTGKKSGETLSCAPGDKLRQFNMKNRLPATANIVIYRSDTLIYYSIANGFPNKSDQSDIPNGSRSVSCITLRFL